MRKLAAEALVAGLIIGTIGYVGTLTGSGDLIPPSGLGWLEVTGFVMVIPAAFILKFV